MREIKFRAWDKKIHKLIKFVCNIDWNHNETVEFVNRKQRKFIELMQFTGLKDKNGKEIYEDDIVDTYPDGKDYPQPGGYGSAGRVIYHIGKIDFSDGDCETDYCGFVSSWDGLAITSKCEVIGNIYENPELLK